MYIFLKNSWISNFIYILRNFRINCLVIMRTDPLIQYLQKFADFFTNIILASFVSGTKNQQVWKCSECIWHIKMNTKNILALWSTHYLFAYSHPTFSAILGEYTYVWRQLNARMYCQIQRKRVNTHSHVSYLLFIFSYSRQITISVMLASEHCSYLICLMLKMPHFPKNMRTYLANIENTLSSHSHLSCSLFVFGYSWQIMVSVMSALYLSVFYLSETI